MPSKQLAILKALTDHLEGINPDNDYDEDLRGKVFRGRLVFGDDAETPFISINEAPRPNFVDDVGDRTERQETWDLLLQGFATEDTENPGDPAYELKAMIEHRMARLVAVEARSGTPAYPDEYLLGGAFEIADIKIGAGVVRQPADNPAGEVCCYIPLTIVRTADLSNPFIVE